MSSRPASPDRFWHQLARTAIRRGLIPIIVTAAFLAALVLNPEFNLSRLLEALQGADYVWLAPAALVFFVGIWLRAVRWGLLLRPIARVPAWRLYPVLIIGFMANNVLPFRAGELVRVHELARREGISRTAALATILVERIFDGLALLGLLGAVSLVVPLADWFVYVLRIGSVLFAGLFLVIVAIALGGARGERLVDRLVSRLPGTLSTRIGALTKTFFIGLSGVRRLDLLVLMALVSLLAWLVESGVYLLVMRAFTIESPVYVGILVTATANLAITLPSSQGGIGPFEFFAAQTLIAFGIDDVKATAYAFVAHATVLLPVIPVGVLLLWRGGRVAARNANSAEAGDA